EKKREIKTEKVSTQQFVENGIEKVTVALKAISIEEITTFITNLDTQKEIKEQKTVQHSSKSLKNNCEDSTEQKLCLN
ncbi:MAG: hypothetical protein OEX22_12770, partial [Cyclobacteriaceae bacterium]|nr:hypothetical protein [Cyclobacteriaceae bacterium]